MKLPLGQLPFPLARQLAFTLLLYACYLPLSGYVPADFRFDAGQYWELSWKFTPSGGFSLLAYDEPLRGYLGPLLILPGRLLCRLTGCSILTGARVLGVGWVTLLFGGVLPALWQRTTGRALPGGRWLLLLLLSFLFWRDHFNFTLTDFPALTLLLLALLAVQQRGAGWALLGGLALAGATNLRPVYLASWPAVAWLFWLGRNQPQPGWQLAGLLLGVGLVFTPQLLLNWRHFHRASPLVHPVGTGRVPLYLQQLTWGTRAQRYETALQPRPGQILLYADPVGVRALPPRPGLAFGSYGHYVRFAGEQPVATAWRYVRHLFNGLDVQYSSPYVKVLRPPGQAGLQLLNYALLGLGGLLLLRRGWWAGWFGMPDKAPVAVVLALGLPALAAVPTLVECRFLLPLHLLLLTVAATAHPQAWWRRQAPRWRLVAGLAGLGWLAACWALSADTARQRVVSGPAVDTLLRTD